MSRLDGFPLTEWPRRQVQRELSGTIFSKDVENLWVSCHNGNNDRAAWAGIHCEAPSGQMITSLSPRVLHKQRPRRPGHYPQSESADKAIDCPWHLLVSDSLSVTFCHRYHSVVCNIAVVSSMSHWASLATARGIHLWNCWNIVYGMYHIVFFWK